MTRTRVAAAVGAVAAACLLAGATWLALPPPADLVARAGVQSLVLEDRHGLPLRTTRAADGSRLRWMRLDEMDADLLVAFVAFEDRRFYEHGGVDLRAAARALRDNLAARRVVSGASTITMQTARLLRPLARTWTGKLRQTLWALRLERHLTKQQILELYLNRVPLGQGTVGVAAAAALYFDGSASNLSLGQAALLAGLAHAPSDHNPLVSPSRARARRARVLERLEALGHLLPGEAARAAAEPVLARPRGAAFLAPHFTTRALLAGVAPDPLTGRVRTSLDLDLQAAIEAEVRHAVRVLDPLDASHAAAVVLTNPTGEILAWVGSPDFWADTMGQVDMVVSRRQPGSALKPFLYGLALDRGYTAASILPDVPQAYQTPTGPYRPRNYDRRYHGPVRLRDALGSSFNVAAVELAARVGPAALLTTLHRAGFASLDAPAEHYGLGLALGNGDVTLLELANAYRSLANRGVWTPYRWARGAPADAAAGRRVLSPAAAALVLDILSDPVARIPGFGVMTPFDFPFPVAVKTGTSRHFTDNWAVAATEGFTVATWVGNFSGRPMRRVSGVSGAGPLLHRAVLAVARRYDPGRLPTPEETGAELHRICPLSGRRPGAHCPSVMEWFLPRTAPQETCDWHRDGQTVFPAEYAEWADRPDGASVLEHRPVAAAAPANAPGVRIVAPLDGDEYGIPPGVEPRFATLALRAAVRDGSGPVRWLVDGRPVVRPLWRLRPGTHVIRAEAGDGSDEVTIVVRP